MLLTKPLCCAVRCCGCIVLSQLIGLAISIGVLVLFVLVFYWYILPWGQEQIVRSLHLPKGTSYNSISDATFNAQKCNGCVLGRNTEWPTTTTGTLHFLDTSAGTVISSTVATSLVASAAIGAGSMLWATLFPSMASMLSFTSGFYEMTHIVELAQYISMIGQLRLNGAPEFLLQFSKTMSWTNFNIPKSITGPLIPIGRRRLGDVTNAGIAAVQPKFEGESGPAKYAKAIGVEPKYLFFYTLVVFGALLVVFHLLFVLWIFLMAAISKKQSFSEIGATWYRKVVWAIVLALLLAQYIFAMTGSYYIYENVRLPNQPKDNNFIIGCIVLVLIIGFTTVFGIVIIAQNKEELKDLGSYAHDQRPFASKYSAYYDEYNYDNRFFFIPRILLAISTGVVVGIVQNPTSQIFCILCLTMLYLALLLIREPNLLRFLYYVGIASVFMKVVLHCLMLLLVHDDVFPQDVRNKASYAIIGINIFIFFLLFIRQAYLIVYKIVQACKHKDKSNTGNDDEDVYARGHGADRNHIETPGREGAAGRYERLESQGHDDRRHSGPHGRPQGNLQQQKYAASTYEADRRGISSGQPQQRPQVGWSDQSGPHGGWNGQPQPINAPTSPTGGMVGGMYSRTSRLKRNDPSTIGITSTAAAVGTDVVAGPTDVREEPPAKAKPQPTWRRNIERRAQEAAAAAAVVAAVDQQRSDQDSASRVGSIDTTSSYDLETGTITQAPVGMHTTQRTSNTSSNDWFQQRLSSNDSEVTQTFTSSALEYRDSDTTDESFITTTPDAPVGPGLTAYGGKKPSIIPLLQTGSFSSSLQREHSPFQGPMINGMDTGELDRVAVGYFQQEAARTNSDTSSGTVKSAMQEDVDIDAMDSDSERGSTRRRSSALDIDQDSEEEGSMGTDDEEETFTSSLLPDRDARVGENDSFVSAMSYEDRR